MMKTLTGAVVGFAILVGSVAYAGTPAGAPSNRTPVPPPAPTSDNLFVVDGKDSAKLTITGEVRTRLEWQRNLQDFNSQKNDDNDYGDSRIRLGLDFKFSDGVSFFFQPQAEYTWGGRSGYNQPGPVQVPGVGDTMASSVDRDSIDVYQAYLTMGGTVAGMETTMQVGRQEIVWGNELVLGRNNNYNGLSLDAVDVKLKPAGWLTIDAFAAKAVENDVVVLNGQYALRPNIGEARRADTQLFGLDFVCKPDPDGDVRLEAYVLLVDSEFHLDEAGNQDSVYASDIGGKLWTIGTYVKIDELSTDLNKYAFDLSFDAATQLGEIDNAAGHGSDVTDVYAIEAEAGFTLHAVQPLKPRVAVGAAAASGDRDADDDTVNSFQPLYQSNENRLGATGLFLLTNLACQYAKVSVSPDFGIGELKKNGKSVRKLEIGAAYYKFESVRKTDEVGGTGMTGATGGKEVADEIDVYTQYLVSKNTSFRLTYAMLEPNDVVREQAALANSPAHRLFLELAVQW